MKALYLISIVEFMTKGEIKHYEQFLHFCIVIIIPSAADELKCTFKLEQG